MKKKREELFNKKKILKNELKTIQQCRSIYKGRKKTIRNFPPSTAMILFWFLRKLNYHRL